MIDRSIGVTFRDITVAEGGRIILEDVSAQAPCGSATVIMGPNGAGKTTLLKCVLGEMRYTGQIGFTDAASDPVNSPVIGYVPQQLAVDAHLPLRVYEFLSLGQAQRPLWLGCGRKTRMRARELLALVEAEKLENSRMGSLSGGELRRVLLAAALGRQPQLLILDEAEAGVDYCGERLFWELLDKTRVTQGFTLLMVSHNLPLAAHYATHVICIKQRLVAQGAPETALAGDTLLELFGVPIHLYPEQCTEPGHPCEECGAFGNRPYLAPDVPCLTKARKSAANSAARAS